MFQATAKHVKKNPSVIAQVVIVCLGIGGGSLHLIRQARGPHIIWDKTNNPEPWNKLDPIYRYKLVVFATNYKNLKEGPDF